VWADRRRSTNRQSVVSLVERRYTAPVRQSNANSRLGRTGPGGLQVRAQVPAAAACIDVRLAGRVCVCVVAMTTRRRRGHVQLSIDISPSVVLSAHH